MTDASPQAADSQAAAFDPAGLIDLSDRLTDLQGRETALLQAMRVREIAALQPEKVRLTRLYQKAITAPPRPLPESVKAELLATGQRLAAATVENERALRVSHTASERLIGAIVTAIKEQQPSITGYTPRMAAPRHVGVSGVTLDRRL
jgi:hypothetical protein